MKKRNYKFFLRKLHRYLGVFIGIQFLLWTLGGLYFSWTNIHEIRGDHLRREKAEINFKQNFISPKAVVEDIEKMAEVSAIIRPAISEDEAKKIAAESLVNSSPFKSIIYLTAENVGGHHEYREKPLPAWAVTFENDLTVYLSAETGQVGAVRTNEWRIFDFLWMLHTMDYRARDDINNYVLRAFSILGIATILSGFILFFVSSKFIARIFFRRASAHIHDSE
jgi:uncharacterized iron-regulated membrane protein